MIDVSSISNDALIDMEKALKIIIANRFKRSNSSNEIQKAKFLNTTKSGEKNTTNKIRKKKIHSIKYIRDLNLNAIKRMDDLLHRAIIKRIKKIHNNDNNKKSTKRIGKKSAFQSQKIKNNPKVLYNVDIFPSINNTKLCEYDFDLLPVKIVNNDKNILSDINLNTLTRRLNCNK